MQLLASWGAKVENAGRQTINSLQTNRGKQHTYSLLFGLLELGHLRRGVVVLSSGQAGLGILPSQLQALADLLLLGLHIACRRGGRADAQLRESAMPIMSCQQATDCMQTGAACLSLNPLLLSCSVNTMILEITERAAQWLPLNSSSPITPDSLFQMMLDQQHGYAWNLLFSLVSCYAQAIPLDKYPATPSDPGPAASAPPQAVNTSVPSMPASLNASTTNMVELWRPPGRPNTSAQAPVPLHCTPLS